MNRTPDQPRGRWLVSFAVILLAAAPNLWITLRAPEQVGARPLAFWWVLYGAFVGAFVFQALCARRWSAAVGLLAAQALLALWANWLIPTVIGGVATGGALLVVVAASLSRLPLRASVPWVLAQSAALLAIYLDSWPTSIALAAGTAYTVFSFVLLSVERLANRERAMRLDLAQTVADLKSTRRLLEYSVRDAERARISRELHDLLGHHLVALSLQLEAAHLTSTDAARPIIDEARALTRLLLADVRAVVADLRDQPPVDLRAALADLATPVPGAQVTIQVEEGCVPGGPLRAMTLLRCAQELLTNARKHARASHISIDVRGDQLTVTDDGVGGPITEGFGLRGMKERVGALGGSVVVEHPGRGTVVRVRIPPAARDGGTGS